MKRLGTVIALLNLVACPGPAIVAFQKPATEEPLEGSYLQKRGFKIEQVGELRDTDGVHLAFKSYRANDGTTVTVVHNEFQSSTAAQEFLEKQVTKALKVMSKGDKMSKRRAANGKRVEVEFDWADSASPIHAILWTSGADFFEVRSTARNDVIEFEKSVS